MPKVSLDCKTYCVRYRAKMRLVEPAQKITIVPSMREGDDSDEAVAERLIRLRAALGIGTVTEMEQRLGVGRERYRNAERGLGLGHALGIQIIRTFAGVSLDWLYLGDPRGLSLTMAERLGELPTNSPPRSRRRKGAGS